LDVWVYEMDPKMRGLAVAGLGPWLGGREGSRAEDGFLPGLPGADVWLRGLRWEDEWVEDGPAPVDAAAERRELIEAEEASHSCDVRLSEYLRLVDRQAGPINFEEVLNG